MSDPDVIGDLIETRKSIKRKFQDLQRGLINDGLARDLAFQPISKPLRELVSETKKKRFGEKKKEPDANDFFSPSPAEPMDLGNLMDESLDRTMLQGKEGEEEEEEEEAFAFEKGKERGKKKKNQARAREEMDGDEDEDSNELYHSILETFPPKTSNQRGFSEFFEEKLGKLSGPYLKLFMENPKETDQQFGIQISKDASGSMMYKIGNTPVSIVDDVITIQNKSDPKKFKSSLGLLELLVKKKPDLSAIGKKDLAAFKQILEMTSSHKVNNQPEGRIKSSGSEKYTSIVSPLFYPKTESGPSATSLATKGSGLRFWNDPNELVQRLMLLKSSKLAGNTAHEAEILSIEEELREANLIY